MTKSPVRLSCAAALTGFVLALQPFAWDPATRAVQVAAAWALDLDAAAGVGASVGGSVSGVAGEVSGAANAAVGLGASAGSGTAALATDGLIGSIAAAARGSATTTSHTPALPGLTDVLHSVFGAMLPSSLSSAATTTSADITGRASFEAAMLRGDIPAAARELLAMSPGPISAATVAALSAELSLQVSPSFTARLVQEARRLQTNPAGDLQESASVTASGKKGQADASVNQSAQQGRSRADRTQSASQANKPSGTGSARNGKGHNATQTVAPTRSAIASVAAESSVAISADTPR